jgi:hypothetical protein
MFTKLHKVAVGFVTPGCLSVRMNFAPASQIFLEMLYWDVLLKSVQKIQVWLKTGQKYIT